MFLKYCRIALLTLLSASSLSGQEDYVRFKQITINEGLSLSSVYTIYQDSKGFMWFGTEDGLNKFDGRTITVFGETTDQHHLLANKWTELIYEDKSGMIWLGSRGGLTMYNPRKGLFTVLKHDPGSATTLSNDTVTSIVSDLRNEVWVGTSSGLNRVDRYTGESERILPNENDLIGLMSEITSLMVDPSGNLWIGTENGLFSHDPKSDLFFNETAGDLIHTNEPVLSLSMGTSFLWVGTARGLLRIDLSGQEHHRMIGKEQGLDMKIRDIHVDRRGQVWIESPGALYCFRGDSAGLFRVMAPDGSTHSLALNPVEPMVEDQEGFIWYGTFGGGVFRIDPVTFDSEHFRHNPADPNSLAENSINCIFEDRSGSMWFGSFGAGISILDPRANQFELFKHDPFNRNSLSSSFIWTILETSDNKLWVGSNDAGVSLYDMDTHRFTHLKHEPGNPSSLPHNSIRKVYQDREGRIWVGTDGGGLGLYLPASGTFRHFRHDPMDPRSLSDNSVRALYEDPEGRFWVGTRHGLNLMNAENGTFRHFFHVPGDPSSLPSNFIYSALYMDDAGLLWIGTYGGGLCRMNPEDGKCTSFRNDSEDPTTISDNIVYAIFEDHLGRFWIGTNSGLNMFYPATGSFRRFGVGEGFANEVIYGILPDEQNNLWMSTNLGIIQFNLETFAVRNYDMNDGLQSNEFNGGAFYLGQNGKLYFGGVYGLNIIDPESIEPVTEVNDVTLTSLEILGKEVQVAKADIEELFEEHPNDIIEYEGAFYSSENVTYMEKIVLDYNERFFSVEFSAMNGLLSGDMSYSYIMENLEEEWTNAGNRNYVSYANMRPGPYTLKVVAINDDGYRSDPPMQLDILITPPYWMSWWFIVLELLLVIIVTVMIYNYLVKSRTNKLLKYQNQQISEANEALRESEKNLMELNATKDKFFSIISHDLKNPFSSLLSISELMVENFDHTDREDHHAGFRKIYQSAKHLFDLLENLLTWSRTQRGKIKYDPVRFNLSSVIRENVNIHKLLAEKKGIMLLSPEEDEIYVYGDRDMINSVLRNLMTNAVKFTDSDKKVEVKVEKKEKEIEVSIIDEGVGIPEEHIDRLFRIDEKYKSNGTAGEKGTGLGLIICREFVEKNGGQISVKSKPGEGSTFVFTIPAVH